MGIHYNKLFQLAKEKGLNKTMLRERAGISSATMAKLSKNEMVGLEVIEKLCRCLNCQPGDVMSYVVKTENRLLNTLREEKNMNLKGGIYHMTQIKLSYNSNRIEGSRLSEDQTRYIFETNTIGMENESTVNIDDIIETTNHFDAFKYLLDVAEEPLTEVMIKEFHRILKAGTSDSRKEWFRVGDYKLKPNMVGDIETSAPEDVEADVRELLRSYERRGERTFDDIIDFHYRFERIHPFQDGNGRVGRLIMFKECLRWNQIPVLIEDSFKQFYYRGLKEYLREPGYLRDTCLHGQDVYGGLVEYFRV